jgi:hypothetical protein
MATPPYPAYRFVDYIPIVDPKAYGHHRLACGITQEDFEPRALGVNIREARD